MTGIFEIEELKVKGQFCLLAFKLYCKHKKIGLQDLGASLFPNENIDLFEFIELMYFSCQAYAELHEKEFKRSIAQFTNDFENVTETSIAAATEKFMEVKLFGRNLLESGQTNSTKKK